MSWLDEARAARDAGATWFCFLDAVDDIGRADTITLALRLTDPATAAATTLSTAVPRDGGSVPSLRSLWPAAGNAERAVAESFGITFDDGDDRPLLLHTDSGVPVHPLRKDVLLAARQDTPWPGSRNDDGRQRRRDTAVGVAEPGADPLERVAQAYGGGRGRR